MTLWCSFRSTTMRRGLGLGVNIGTNMLPNIGAKLGTNSRALGNMKALAFQRGMASSAKLDPVQVCKTMSPPTMRINFVPQFVGSTVI